MRNMVRKLAATSVIVTLAASSVAAEETVLPAAEQAAAPKPSVIMKPPWKKLPTSDQITKLYPARALRQQVPGRAVVRCIVGKKGEMTACAVTEETPAGYGFGAAALKLSRRFSMHTSAPMLGSTVGAIVFIPMGFGTK